MYKGALFILATLVLWSCHDTALSPTALSPDGQARLTLALRSASQSGSAASSLSTAADVGNVPASAVDAINVNLTRVEVRPATGGGWIGLDVVSGGAINLLDLPTDAEDEPVAIARGELEPGDFIAARLFFDDGSVVLNREVCLGSATGASGTAGPPCLAAGEHDLRVPGSDRTGIKTDAHFSVVAGEATTVELTFDPNATFRSITWAPGLGSVMVAPVFRGTDGE